MLGINFDIFDNFDMGYNELNIIGVSVSTVCGRGREYR